MNRLHNVLTDVRLWLLALAAIFASADPADAAISWEKDFSRAAATAASSKKPMLIKVGASWCGYCKKMDRVAFADPKVIGRVKSCFIPVSLDADRDQRFVRQMAVRSLPTTLIVSPDMKVLARLSGYKSAGQLVTEIEKVCSKPKVPIQPAAAKVAQTVSAFKGMCLVSLLDDRKLAKGNPAITSTVAGQTVAFASAEHKRKFDANPTRYWPVMDGVCLVTFGTNSKVAVGEVKYGLHYKNRVWLFSGADQQKKFIENPEQYTRVVQSLRTQLSSQSQR